MTFVHCKYRAASTFLTFSTVFCKKYRELNDDGVNKFDYYVKEWVKSKLNGWHERLGWYVPSTNNRLESTNQKIKDCHTLRNRAPLGYFLSSLFTIIKRFSNTA